MLSMKDLMLHQFKGRKGLAIHRVWTGRDLSNYMRDGVKLIELMIQGFRVAYCV